MSDSDFQLGLERRMLLSGFSGGLAEKTAIVDLVVSGIPAYSASIDQRLHECALGLYPSRRLFSVAESDWPTAFLKPTDLGDLGVEWLGSWIVALTVAIQRFGRDPVWRGRVISAERHRLRLAIPWTRNVFFGQALDLALELVRCAVTGSDGVPVELQAHFGGNWAAICANGMQPNTLRFIQAAAARDIPFAVLPNFVQLGWGANAERFDMSFTGRTSWIAEAMARDKWNSKRTLARAEITVPHAWVVHNVTDAEYAAANLAGWPVAVKPFNRSPGQPDNGVTTGVPDPEILRGAFERASQCGTGGVIVEEHIAGDDHRLLVVNGSLLSAVRRKVQGDNRFGWIEDVTASVHPDNRALVERVARVAGLDIAGVDVLTPDISRPWQEVGGAVYGVCGQPDFSPHWAADPDRDLNGEVLDSVFAGLPARIPTAAITGTNGKTTTSEMLFSIWTAAGKRAGVCTTVAVRIGNQQVTAKNLSGWPGARILLEDPGVEAAVFEMPRKGLLKFGHPCDRYDVAALLNVQNDHIGDEGIDTLEQMAELKAEVLQRASRAVVVNADDPLCMAVRWRAGTDRHILVFGNPDNPALHEHRRSGGEAVFVADRNGAPCVVVATGDREEILMPVRDIPATMNGLLRFNVSNAMFAVGLAWGQGLAPAIIRRGLGEFRNSQDINPGRYNFIDGFPAQVLFDYAHNADGFREICAVVAEMPVTGRRILYSRGLGQHSAAQFAEVAPLMAEHFDEFVISCALRFASVCPDYAGPDPVATMLSMSAARLHVAGVAAEAVTTTGDRMEALSAVLSRGVPGDLVVVLDEPNVAFPVIDELRSLREQT